MRRQRRAVVEREPGPRLAGVDLAQSKPVLGPVLEVLPEEERFASRSECDLGAFANWLARGTYRPPYVVPETVQPRRARRSYAVSRYPMASRTRVSRP